jgi:uncharacterized membrane protein YkvA (DUF1232 family)
MSGNQVMTSEQRASDEFSRQFSDDGFWKKLSRYARSAGSPIVERALELYYASQNPATPAWARGVIFGALGYFIAPVDAITDLVPAVGYSDDFGVLVLAVAAIATHITPEVKQQAREKLEEWFG